MAHSKRWLGAAALLAAATFVLFFPYLVRGEVFFDAGTLNHCMPSGGTMPASARVVPLTTDLFGFYWPFFRFLDQELQEGRFGLWNPRLQAGIPFHAIGEYPGFSPLYLPLLLVFDAADTLHVAAMLKVWGGGLFFYLLARAVGASWVGGVLGALIWSFGGFTAFYLLSPSIGIATFFLPLELWLGLEAARRRSFGLYAALGLALGCDGLTSHLGHFAANLVVLASTWLWERRAAHAAGLAAAVAAGMLVAAPAIVPFVELLGRSPRIFRADEEVVRGWGTCGLAVTTLAPRLLGGPSEATDLHALLSWRPLYLGLAMGAAGCVSALLAVAGGTARRMAVAAAALWLLMTLPPLSKLWISVPGLNLTRAYYFWHAVLLALALLAALGAHRLLMPRQADRRRARWIFRGAMAAAVGMALLSVMHAAGVAPSHRVARALDWFGLHNPAVGLPVLALIVVAALTLRTDVPRRFRALVMLALTAGELVPFVARQQTPVPRGRLYPGIALPDVPDRAVYRRPDEYWFSNPPNLLSAYGIETPEIYAPIRPRWVPELLSPPGVEPVYSRGTGVDASNVRELHLMQVSSIVRLKPPATYSISSVPGAPPRAFFVGRSEVIPSAAERLRRLRAPGFDLATTVVLEEGVPLGGTWGAEAVLRRRVSNHVVVTVSTPGPGFLVLLDAWYPGWEATVDGRPVEILRANHAFRAVALQTAGEHTVEFRYAPSSVRTGLILSAAALVMLVVIGSLQGRPRILRR